MERAKKSTSAFKLFENRRKYPRLKLSNQPVKVTGAGGKILKATLHDISPDGAQLRYLISEGLNLFVDDQTNVTEKKPVKCLLEFPLAFMGEKINVKLQAKPVYIRPISQRVMAAGVIFVENDLSELKKVSDFLFMQLELSYTRSGNWSGSENKPVAEQKPEVNPPGSAEATAVEEVVKIEPAGEVISGQAQDSKETVVEEEVRGNGAEPEVVKEDTEAPSPPTEEVRPESNSTNVVFLHAEIRRLASGMKMLLETTRRLDARIQKIEQFLSKKTEK